MNFCHSVILLLPFIGLTMTQEYVNSDPASYQFSYNTGDSGPAKMFREEQRAASGQVTGKYGYVDPYGHMRIVQYEAGPQGFIARGDVGPDREAMRIARQLADQDYQEKLPILQQWNAVAARLSAGPSFPAWPAPVVPSTSSVGSSSSSSSSSSGNALVPPSPSSVERARLTASNQAAWAPATGSAHSFTNHVNRNSQVENLLVDRVARFLESHTLQFKVPDSSISEFRQTVDEARKKKPKKILLPLLLLLKFKAAALIPLVLGALALLALKALIVGKLALVLSALIGLQKLLASKHHTQSYEVVAHPHYSEHDHGHYARSLKDPSEKAYSAHDPSKKSQ